MVQPECNGCDDYGECDRMGCEKTQNTQVKKIETVICSCCKRKILHDNAELDLFIDGLVCTPCSVFLSKYRNNLICSKCNEIEEQIEEEYKIEVSKPVFEKFKDWVLMPTNVKLHLQVHELPILKIEFKMSDNPLYWNRKEAVKEAVELYGNIIMFPTKKLKLKNILQIKK
jgi:hypothetical protein